MDTTVDVVLPVFALVAVGYAVGRTRLLGDGGVQGISNFVFYVAIPTLLFRTMSRIELPEIGSLGIVFAYFGGCLLVFPVAALAGRLLFGIGRDERAVMGMGAVFSNTVLLGIPLIFTAFGEDGVIAIMLIVAFHSITLISLPTILLEVARGERGRSGRVIGSTLSALARNPVIVAMLAGLAYGGLGFTLPAPVDRFAGLMSGAAAPCALFALGASLAGYRIAGSLRETFTLIGFKLLVHPVAVWLLGRYVFDLAPLWLAVATITAALPVGANVFVLARRYDVYVQRATSATLISTALSVVSLAVLIACFAPTG